MPTQILLKQFLWRMQTSLRALPSGHIVHSFHRTTASVLWMSRMHYRCLHTCIGLSSVPCKFTFITVLTHTSEESTVAKKGLAWIGCTQHHIQHLTRQRLSSWYCAQTDASPEFQDLILRLLDKNPAMRLSWRGMCEHCFWQTPLPQRAMPPEPMLDAFIKRHGLRPPVQPAAADVRDTLDSQIRAAQVGQHCTLLMMSILSM